MPGPIQVIGLDVLPGNTPPTAAATATCTDLLCRFSSAASSDIDGTIASYEWDFGDGSPPVVEAHPTHPYAAPGTYEVRLTVTDDQGATDTRTIQASVVVSTIAFVAANATNVAAKTPKVALPAGIQTGDRMVLLATSLAATSASAPAGWERLHQGTSAAVLTTVWQRAVTAADRAGAAVMVTYDVWTKSDVKLLVYRGAGQLPAAAVRVAGTGTTTWHPR